jgi:hypothetical protein
MRDIESALRLCANPPPKRHLMKNTVTFLATTLVTCAAIAQGVQAPPSAAPYAGQQVRGIKALSEDDITALLAGQGMGLAKAAELHGYPGPAHTLELKEPLSLTPAQVLATEALMARHKARARELGEAAVRAERELDTLFASRQATPATVREATERVALLQATLRAEHLNTHLDQTALMSHAQVLRYAQLRGYASAAPAASKEHGHGHKHRH